MDRAVARLRSMKKLGEHKDIPFDARLGCLYGKSPETLSTAYLVLDCRAERLGQVGPRPVYERDNTLSFQTQVG